MTQPDFPCYNTVDQIYHAEWSTPKLARLELMRQSIRTLWPDGHPTKLIHVAGTGGKGSTCRFLEAGLSTIGRLEQNAPRATGLIPVQPDHKRRIGFLHIGEKS